MNPRSQINSGKYSSHLVAVKSDVYKELPLFPGVSFSGGGWCELAAVDFSRPGRALELGFWSWWPSASSPSLSFSVALSHSLLLSLARSLFPSLSVLSFFFFSFLFSSFPFLRFTFLWFLWPSDTNHLKKIPHTNDVACSNLSF